MEKAGLYSKKPELILPAKTVESRAKMQFDFLKVVHPFSTTAGWKDGAIEVKRLIRGNGETKNYHSYITWTLHSETDFKYYLDLAEKANGLSLCTYYSCYAFNERIVNKNGYRGICKENAIYTSVLMMDFDKISEAEFLKQKQRLLDIGIETFDIFTGHGYQSLILLDSKVYDTELFSKFTALMLEKGFSVDESIVDASRVARMPFTSNCKTYLDNGGEPAPFTYIYRKTEKRYNVDDVFSRIGELEKVNNDAIVNTYTTPAPVIKEYTKDGKDKPNIQVMSIDSLPSLYPSIVSVNTLPRAIQNMLLGATEGLRNKVLMFIVPYFKNSLGFGIAETIEALKVWGALSTPSIAENEIKSEVERLWVYDIKALYGAFTEELEHEYGVLEFSNWRNEDKIQIHTVVFERIKEISDGAFRIYLGAKLLEHEEQRSNFTKDEICERIGIATRTFEKHIGYLTKIGILTKKTHNTAKRKGEGYQYYLSPYINEYKGFTLFEASLIDLLLEKDLNDAQISFYLYLKHFFRGGKESTYKISQPALAERLGKKSHTTISKLTDDLVKKKMIRKTTEGHGRAVISTYTLLK